MDNEALKIIETLKSVFDLATTGFNIFYKETEEKSKSSGDYSTAASSGDSSTAASSGDSSKAASSGDSSTAASSGYSSKAASSGNYSTAASSGDSSKAASSGDSSKAASSGDSSKAESNGENCASTAVGYRAAVRGDKGSLIMASEYKKNKDGKLIVVGGKADIVDGKKLKPQQWYIVENKKWVAVDFSDGVFSYVISSKKNVKKVKTENGDILFVVSDDNGNSAHGGTVAKAREDLIYKVTAKFEGELPKKSTVKEWIPIYRAVTGACASGVKNFIQSRGLDLDKVMTKEEVMKEVAGNYGSEKFKEAGRK